jgi:hypothetical protein
MKLTERNISVLSLVVAVLSITVSVILGLAALSQNMSIAVDSGTLKKAKIKAFIGDVDLLSGKEHRIIFGSSQKQLDNGLVIAPFTIVVKNIGDEKLENLYLTYRYHKKLKRSVLEHLKYNAAGSFVDGDLIKKFSSSGVTDYITYQLPKLNPSVAVAIDEPFLLKETEVSESVTVDNYFYTFILRYSIKFQLSISASTSEHQDYDFNVSVIASENLNELQRKFIEQVVVKEMEKLRSKSSIIQYLGVLLFGNEERDAVLIYPKNQRIERDDSVIFIPNDGKVDIRTVWYRPAAWNWLL